MLEKLSSLIARYKEIEEHLANVGDDYTTAIELSKERAELEPVVKEALAYQEALTKIEETQELLNSEDDEELHLLAEMELSELRDTWISLRINSKVC